MTEDERQAKRERDRRNAREYRARKRAEAAERARTAADGEPGPMRQSLEVSIAAAKWLTGSDAAALAQLRSLADIVDRAHADGDTRIELRGHSLFARVLGESALTPRVRMHLELRSRKSEAAAEAAAIEKAPNVTRLQRPPKRS